MRLGVMVGPERGRYSTKVERMVADATWAEEAGLASLWIPQIPDDFDALTAAVLIGSATSRIEIGTAVVPIQPRHPVALAHQVLSTQAVCEGRLTLGLGVSHHWVIDEMLGLPYERPAATMRDYLDVARPGTGPPRNGRRRQRAVPRPPADGHDRHRPDAGDDRRPGAGDAADAPGNVPTGPSCGWPTSGPSRPTSPPMLHAAATAAGRPTPRIVAGVPGLPVR